GLTLDPVTGVISGTPTATGSFTFTVSVLDILVTSASHSFTIAIATAPAVDTTAPDGVVLFDGSPATITSPAATVDLTATDAVGVTGYRFAEGSDCSAASWVSVSS